MNGQEFEMLVTERMVRDNEILRGLFPHHAAEFDLSTILKTWRVIGNIPVVENMSKRKKKRVKPGDLVQFYLGGELVEGAFVRVPKEAKWQHLWIVETRDGDTFYVDPKLAEYKGKN